MALKDQPKRALLVGAAWAIGVRWSNRLLGLVSTTIMARLLMPADYGLVAMASLVVGILQALVDFGIAPLLLRKKDIDRDEIDSAWTLGVIEGLVIATLLVLASWPASIYFKESRVVPILLVYAACTALVFTGNIGVLLARKEMNFALEFRINLIGKSLSVLATVGAGLLLRDYRALVVGIAVGYVSGFVLSYVMHPYRPRWNTSRVGETWHLAKWLMVGGIGGFLLRKSDELIAARIGGASKYGLYNMGADLGQLPTGEIGPALLRAFLPVLSTIQDDVKRTNAAVIKTLAAINSLTLVVGLTFAALATPATLLLLGPKWLDAAIFVAIFAVVGTMQSMYSPLNTLLVLRGHLRAQTTNVWIEFAVFVAAALAFSSWLGFVALAVARVIATASNLMLTAFVAQRRCGLSLRAVAVALGRPLVGALAAAGLAHETVRMLAHPLTQVLAGGAVATCVYFAWSFISWMLSGRPEGLESTVADRIASWRVERADRRKQVESA